MRCQNLSCDFFLSNKVFQTSSHFLGHTVDAIVHVNYALKSNQLAIIFGNSFLHISFFDILIVITKCAAV